MFTLMQNGHQSNLTSEEVSRILNDPRTTITKTRRHLERDILYLHSVYQDNEGEDHHVLSSIICPLGVDWRAMLLDHGCKVA